MNTKSFVSENWLLAATITIALGAGFCSVPAGAADNDMDGLPDGSEPTTLSTGLSNAFGSYVQALAVGTKDLYVYIVPDSTNSNSNLSNVSPPLSDPLEFLKSLGLALHSWNSRTSPASPQMALYIKEIAGSDPTPTDTTTLGETKTIGNINAASGATVYTRRIRNYLRKLCYGSINCFDALGPSPAESFTGQLMPLTSPPTPPTPLTLVEARYIKQVINHEAGHNMLLKSPLDKKTTIGYHYPSTDVLPAATYIMNDKAFVRGNGTNSVTWYIGTQFPSMDKNSLKLIP
jgi:hypothetical protein